MVEIDHEYKDILDRTRSVLLEKVEKLQEVAKEDAGEWFDETGSLSAENQLKGAIKPDKAEKAAHSTSNGLGISGKTEGGAQKSGHERAK